MNVIGWIRWEKFHRGGTVNLDVGPEPHIPGRYVGEVDTDTVRAYMPGYLPLAEANAHADADMHAEAIMRAAHQQS